MNTFELAAAVAVGVAIGTWVGESLSLWIERTRGQAKRAHAATRKRCLCPRGKHREGPSVYDPFNGDRDGATLWTRKAKCRDCETETAREVIPRKDVPAWVTESVSFSFWGPMFGHTDDDDEPWKGQS